MQIVINIPDDFYERVNKDGCMSYTDAEVVVNAFCLGKPLPKGHGDLKDTDKLAIKIAMIRDTHNAYSDNEYERALFQAYDICVDKILDARTIIAADEEADE